MNKKNYCDDCINKNIKCDICIKNPIYKHLKNYHKVYKPVCPLGHTDCICDPGYIYYHYPDWYKELYGDKSPKEIAKTCCQTFEWSDNPNFCWNYDNEDK